MTQELNVQKESKVENTVVLSDDDLFSFLNPGVRKAIVAQATDISDIKEWINQSQDGDMIVYSDGIYILNKRTIGAFLTVKEEFKVKIPQYPTGSALFVKNEELPKVPGYLFKGIINFYQKIHSINKNEVMAQIWWDKVNKEYKVEVPEQKVSGASIQYDSVKGFYSNPDMELIVTSHSHHTMSAFFSGTDNSDEKGKNGIYSFVFGNLVNAPDGKTFTYSTVQRVCFGSTLINLNIDDFIDMHAEGNFEIPEEDYAKVVPYTPTYPTYPYTGAGATRYYNPGTSAAKKINPYEIDDEDYAMFYGHCNDGYSSYAVRHGKANAGAGNVTQYQYGKTYTNEQDIYGAEDSGVYSYDSKGKRVKYNDFGDDVDIYGYFSPMSNMNFNKVDSEDFVYDMYFGAQWDSWGEAYLSDRAAIEKFTNLINQLKETIEDPKNGTDNIFFTEFLSHYLDGIRIYISQKVCISDVHSADIISDTSIYAAGMSLFAMQYASAKTLSSSNVLGFSEDVLPAAKVLLDKVIDFVI